MTDVKKLILALRKFNKDRDWEKYHNAKDLAISISLESSELVELFQWQTGSEIVKATKEKKNEIVSELADILKYSLMLADNLGIDLVVEAIKKLEKDSAKYPVEKVKGKYIKYTKIK